MDKSIEIKNPEKEISSDIENRWNELEARMEGSELDQELQRTVKELYRENKTLNQVFTYLKEKRSNDKARRFLDEDLIISPKLINALMKVENMSPKKQQEIVNNAILETYIAYQNDFEKDQRKPFEVIYQAYQENKKLDQPEFPNDLPDFINKRVIRTLYAKDMPQEKISEDSPNEFETLAAIIIACKEKDKAQEIAA
jgi:hypothetical protein